MFSEDRIRGIIREEMENLGSEDPVISVRGFGSHPRSGIIRRIEDISGNIPSLVDERGYYDDYVISRVNLLLSLMSSLRDFEMSQEEDNI